MVAARPQSTILTATSSPPSLYRVAVSTATILLLGLSSVAQAFNECEFYYYDLTRGSSNDFRSNCPRRTGGENNKIDDPNFPTIKIAWIPAPPYLIDEGGNTPGGIFPQLIDDWLRTACKGYQYGNRPFRFTWHKKTATSIKSMVETCRDGSWNDCSFSVPTIGMLNKDWGNGIAYRTPFAGFYKIPGVVYVTVQGQLWRKSITSFGQSVVNVWPFMVLCLLMALISGSIMWLLDTWTNDNDFPRSFFPGIYHGFWWSFVSMTTVGYGDKAPVSVMGRLFSVIWIIVGISMIGILTSMLASAMTGATSVAEKVVDKARVGVLPGTESANIIAAKLDGIEVPVADIDELHNLLARGLLTGFVMDVYTYQYYYNSVLSKLDVTYVVEKKFDMDNYYYGMSFFRMDNVNSATPEEWRTCLENYIEYNYHFRDKMERHYRDEVFDLIDPDSLIPKDDAPLSLFDINSDFFLDLMWTIGMITLAIFVIGLVFEAFRLLFFGAGALALSERLGLAHNAGYVADGENPEGKENDASPSKKMTREERQISELVDKTVRHTEEHMQSTEREVKNEIREMVRSIRRQMADMKRRNDKDYGLS